MIDDLHLTNINKECPYFKDCNDYGIRCEYYNVFFDNEFDCKECEKNG